MERLIFQIKKLNDLMRKNANKHLDSLGLTFTQHFVLVHLYENHDCLSLKELEKRFHVAQATMAGIIQRLESKKYIESFYKPEDKRVKYVRLTEEGKALCEESKQAFHRREAEVQDLFTPEEYSHLSEYVQRIYTYIEKEDTTCSKV